MADAAAVKSIPLMTVTDGEFQDDSLPTDSVLPPGTYIDGESIGFKTPSLNKGVLADDGNVPDLTLAPIETTLVMQRTASVSEMVTSMHQMERSTEVNVERPSLLPGDLKSETKVCTSVTTGGTVDRISENITSFYWILRIHQRACPGFRWILMQICGHLLLMAAWFLKPRNKNGMLSSQAYRSWRKVTHKQGNRLVYEPFSISF